MMSEGKDSPARSPINHFRAAYSFELGVWRATCVGCGWRTANSSRRRAVAQFRLHNREVASRPPVEADLFDVPVIDLREISVVSEEV